MSKCLLTAIILFTLVCIGQASAAWYNGDWLYRIPITIDAGQVNGDQTDFPVYIDLSDLDGTGLFANAQSNGDDLRITKSDGTTEVPIELVFFDTGTPNGGELHFKASGTLSGTSNSDWYLYYGNSGATGYAPSATYGAENVWSDYEGVFHLQEDPSGSAPQMVDSTGNSNDGTSSGSMTTDDLVTAQIEYGLDFDGTGDYLTCSNNYVLSSVTNKTISAWAQHDAAAANDAIAGLWGTSGQYLQSLTTATDGFLTGVSGIAYGSIQTTTTGSLRHIVSAYDGTLSGNSNRLKLYLNSIQQTLTFTGTIPANYSVGAGTFKIGDLSAFARYWDGIIDEVRISNDTKTSAWISTEYNNQSSPGTFYSIGTQENAPAAATTNALFFGTLF